MLIKHATETHPYEMYAIHLLMCSPHPLSRAWTDAKDDELKARIEEALKVLPLSTDVKAAAMELFLALSSQRAFFRGIADTLRDSDLYAGNEPHPPEPDTRLIIQALQALDSHRAARQ